MMANIKKVGHRLRLISVLLGADEEELGVVMFMLAQQVQAMADHQVQLLETIGRMNIQIMELNATVRFMKENFTRAPALQNS